MPRRFIKKWRRFCVEWFTLRGNLFYRLLKHALGEIILWDIFYNIEFNAILELAKVKMEAVDVIADRMILGDTTALIGSRMIEDKYHTKVYVIITEEDINHAIHHGII